MRPSHYTIYLYLLLFITRNDKLLYVSLANNKHGVTSNMKITIDFNTDNQAFESNDSFEKINIKEVQSVMDQVKREVTYLIQTNFDYTTRINDSNGNMIGHLKIESEKIGI